MARLVVDSSDDELPYMASMLKSRPKSTKSRTSETTSKKAQPQREHTPERTEKSMKKLDGRREDARDRERSLELAVPKSVVRRRILKPMAENPLLLPISSSRKDIDAKRPRTKITQIEKDIGSKRATMGSEESGLNVRKSSETMDISSDDDVFFDAISTNPSSGEPDKVKVPKLKSFEIFKPSDSKKSSIGDRVAKKGGLPDDSDVFLDNTRSRSKDSKEAPIPKREYPEKSIQTQLKTATEKEAVSRIRGRKPTYQEPHTSEPEDNSLHESSGISDFIVEDEESIFEYSEDEDDLVLPSPPVVPKSARKLVRGRRPERKASIDEDDVLERIKKMGLEDSSDDMDNLGDLLSRTKIKKDIHTKSDTGRSKKTGPVEPVSEHRITLPPRKDAVDKRNPRSVPSSFEHPSAILEFSPPRSKSPIKTIPGKSPTKLRSPKKPWVPPTFSQTTTMPVSWEPPISADDRVHAPGQPLPAQSAEAKSLKDYKVAFNKIKYDIAVKFLQDLDEIISSGEIGRRLNQTGGIGLEWSKRLLSTAGQARMGTGRNGVPRARIQLAEKVLDNEARLLNTLAHEFCHVAVYIVNGDRKEKHGKLFYSWAGKIERNANAMDPNTLMSRHWQREQQRDTREPRFRRKFGYPRIQIKISTCHSWKLSFKFEWECVECKRIYGRHSQSIDPSKHRCSCPSKGGLIQIKPVSRAPRAATEYQKFLKDNMAIVKNENPHLSQNEIMRKIGEVYRETKAGKSVLSVEVAGEMKSLGDAIDGLGYAGKGSEDSIENEFVHSRDLASNYDEKEEEDMELGPFPSPKAKKTATFLDLTEDDMELDSLPSPRAKKTSKFIDLTEDEEEDMEFLP